MSCVDFIFFKKNDGVKSNESQLSLGHALVIDEEGLVWSSLDVGVKGGLSIFGISKGIKFLKVVVFKDQPTLAY